MNNQITQTTPRATGNDAHTQKIAFKDLVMTPRSAAFFAEDADALKEQNAALLDALTRLVHPMAGEDDVDHARAILAKLGVES